VAENKIIRDGWVRICGEDLSEFHRDLIKSIPKYASLAVTEGMLPANSEVLSLEERSLLPAIQKDRSARGNRDAMVVEMFRNAVQKVMREETPRIVNVNNGFKHPLAPKVPHTVVFGPIVVPPGCSATVQVYPECLLFRGERIISLGDGDLLIEGLFVGQRSQLPCQLPNPPIVAAAFAKEHDYLGGVQLDTCEKSFAITWLIRNPTNKPKTFHAAIEGQAIDPPVKVAAAPRGRRWIVGLPDVVVPPLETVTVQVQPQCYFRGEYIINNSGDEGLEIRSLLVGDRSQLVDGAHLLLHSRFELRLDSCHPALSIAMQIHNPSNQPKKFACSIIGSAVL
jgi:hypothetical protein